MPEDFKTKENRNQEEESPRHPRWKNILSLYSWWQAIDGRTLVICQRWSDNHGNIEYVEILEKDNELLKLVPWEIFVTEFKRGKLTKLSLPTGADLPRVPHDLYPDRNY